jgi:enoyl-CoA hydratase/carnithine racemase
MALQPLSQIDLHRFPRRLEVQLNRPEKRNALTAAMYNAMADALEEGAGEQEVRAVIFYGEGECFCAGNDLSDFLAGDRRTGGAAVDRFLRVLSTSDCVLIAAIQGPTVGIGATMLLHFDYVAAAEDAVLRFPFMPLGLVPEAASSMLLPAAVGRLKAAELLLTGEAVPAQRALALGLVSQTVSPGEQLEAARAFSARVEDMPAGALSATKRLLRSSTTSVQERVEEEAREFRARLTSDEFRAAAQSVLERRSVQH